MRYISLFSGIEAASVAWGPLGFEPVAFSEIEPFPCAVLAHRFPDVPNLGDVTKIDWGEVKSRYGAVDLVVGGSPCQSFSVAGGRESLGGESRLMFEYIRACEEIRSTWILWENVPGVLSTKDDAFRQLIDTLQDIGYVSLAWRVLDSQFDGVAQRRRRVFLVGRLGSGGGAAAVLFDADSVRGNTCTSQEKREALTGASAGGTRASGFKWHQGSGANGLGWEDEQSPTLTADWHNPAVAIRTANTSSNGWGISEELSHTLDTTGPEAICIAGDHVNAPINTEICGTLRAHHNPASVTYGTVVRRLTPLECERLQGFPDNWTDIPCKGKDHPPDGPRYKAIGNSMAVPVMRWIGERIAMVDSIIN